MESWQQRSIGASRPSHMEPSKVHPKQRPRPQPSSCTVTPLPKGPSRRFNSITLEVFLFLVFVISCGSVFGFPYMFLSLFESLNFLFSGFWVARRFGNKVQTILQLSIRPVKLVRAILGHFYTQIKAVDGRTLINCILKL
jgi:hypothetical protein